MRLIRNVAAASIGILAMSSCTSFNDNLQPCPDPTPDPVPTKQAAELTFVYDYNMDYKDYFDVQVHCIDLYLFDENGNKVTSYHDSDKDNGGNYSVPIDLYPGDYTVVVYGGTACKDASFEKLFEDNDNLKLTDLKVDMKKSYFYMKDESTDAPGSLYSTLSEEEHNSLRLHRLFYGQSKFKIEDTKAAVAIDPIPLQRNTNIIKVSISNKNGNTILKDDYHLLIADDNNTYNYKNELEKTGEIYYRPYVKDDNTSDNEMSAEFTISRLVTSNNPLLVITDANSQKVVPDVNIKKKILESNTTSLPEQEYLDRENSWLITIELGDDPLGLDAKISVKPWDYNQIEMDM